MSAWVFRRTRTGAWGLRLDQAEREVLVDVVDEVLDLLGATPSDPGDRPAEQLTAPLLPAAYPPLDRPQDPALARLLPDGSSDPEVAAEFRRLSEGDVRATKVANLTALRALLTAERAVLRPADAPAVAAALTDLRLVVSERLGIRTDEDAEAVYELAVTPLPPGHPDTPRSVLAALYAVLSQLQETLVGLMLDQLPAADPH